MIVNVLPPTFKVSAFVANIYNCVIQDAKTLFRFVSIKTLFKKSHYMQHVVNTPGVAGAFLQTGR